MKIASSFSPLYVLLFSSLWHLSLSLSDFEVSAIAHRQLLSLKQNDDLTHDFEYSIKLNITFANNRLKRAYIALQAWKKAIYSDPFNSTTNWVGCDVCAYNGVFCAEALDVPKQTVVAGIDLNHDDIAGFLPVELGLLTEISLFHINSNRFCGIIPKSFSKLALLYELDVSNNRFVGSFPTVVLSLPSLRYLDLRYNNFEGKLPDGLFRKELDALFLNNNRFTSTIPETLGSSPASVVVVANNNLTGCIPCSIGNMANTLNEIIFLNNNLSGCLPSEIGKLGKLTVLDVSSNTFTGALPKSFKDLGKLEVFDVSHNILTGFVPESICGLPNLENFTFSYNYFNGEAPVCQKPSRKDFIRDDTGNCLPDRQKQKPQKTCHPIVSKPVDCSKAKCGGPSLGHSPATKSPPSPPPSRSPPSTSKSHPVTTTIKLTTNHT
ncbi:hypothetical protein MANES_18G026715v8 [Manihot esculenta]|uniref:Uncharacterized protein n=1 Tax=Manihot esculenta TaxID=3983 RepID=A0ACB7FX90_MANES|nr:hypothetical protein MANES_18G026715v8 [Manihot esculenta]